MSKKLLYLFGEPGTGKITIAHILQARLGWRLFWLHDLDPICSIVGRYPLPRLMDRVSLAVLEELMEAGENIVYVRPSRDRESVARVLDLARFAGYESYPIRLWAPRWALLERVATREPSQFRVGNNEQLTRYLDNRPSTSDCLASMTVNTFDQTPEQSADEIERYLLTERKADGKRGRRTNCRAASEQATGLSGGCAAVQS